jgi:4-diphosphocytidyl-2-C-methyl-D-erythritol kinase
VVVFPNCKINLGLHVTRKREDGYHDLETIFYPLPLHDVLEVVKRQSAIPDKSAASISISGLAVQGNPEDNLCSKAYNLLKKDHPQLGDVDMYAPVWVAALPMALSPYNYSTTNFN